MRITKDGDSFRGSHITGPTHNFLRMRVRDTNHDSFDVRVLPPVGGCSHGEPIAAEEARDWVRAGVARANEELRMSYGVFEVEVIANDSRRPEVYVELARRIILAAHRDV